MLQKYLTDWVYSVGFSNTDGGAHFTPRLRTNLTREIILKHVPNSPLCNSSSRASTVVQEGKKITQKVLSAWMNSSVHVCPGKGGAWACMQTMERKCTSLDTERDSVRSWVTEVQDKGTSTSSLSSALRLDRADDRVKYVWPSCTLTPMQLFEWNYIKTLHSINDNDSYYNLSKDMNYFVLVPSVVYKTLVDRWSCNVEYKFPSNIFNEAHLKGQKHQ